MEIDMNAVAKAKEKISAMDMTLKMSGTLFKAEKTLINLQSVYKQVVIPAQDCDEAPCHIETCLEDTCAWKLDDAFDLQSKTEKISSVKRD
eukprot:6177694-Ditylum_brightwellii.AAC.1